MSDDPWNPTSGGKTQGVVDNVTDFEAAREKARERAEAEAKKMTRKMQGDGLGEKPMSFVQMYEMLTLRMAGDPTATALNMPEPKEKLIVVSDDGARMRRSVRAEQGDVVWNVDSDYVADVLLRYAHDQAKTVRGLWSYGAMEWRHAKDAARFWRAMAPVVVGPQSLRFASDPGLCYHRAPFDPTPGEMPLIDEFFSRMSEYSRGAVRAWIGSLFATNADRQQYVWLFGHGGDGKGALARLLQRIMGPAAITQSAAPKPSNKHWAVPFVGRRLVVFADLKESTALMSGEMRSLTGGDRIYVDPKSKDGYEYDPVCKLLFLSNEMPSLSSQKADTRRIIYAEMTDSPIQVDPAYEERLWREAPAFIASCQDAYRRACPNGGPIPLTAEAIAVTSDMGSALDDEFEAVLDEYFNVNANGYTTPLEMHAKLDLRWKHDRPRRLAFVSWLAKRGVRKKTLREAGNKKVYVGITAKSSFGQY